MYKNQLQELAQRSCFNLPSYTCIREGPDHAPRFKATANFNGETFESPHYCSTLRQAEHSAAEVALQSLSNRGPSHSLAARILDETGVYKNLLQEIAQRVGAPLPQYTTFRSGLGHLPIFTGTVVLAGIKFTGEPAKNKKQAEKNAAMAAWTSLKLLAKENASSSEPENNDELEQITIARELLNYRIKEKMALANSFNGPILFTKKFPIQNPRPISPQPPATTSKILPLICPKLVSRNRSKSAAANDKPIPTSYQTPVPESHGARPQKFPAAGAVPYVPIRQLRAPCHGIAPPVTIRTAVPVFSAPPRPSPSAVSPQPPASAIPTHPAQYLLPAQQPQSVPPHQSPSLLPTQVLRAPVRSAPSITIRQAVPVFAAPPLRNEGIATFTAAALPYKSPAQAEEAASTTSKNLQESETVQSFRTSQNLMATKDRNSNSRQ
ncbi:double-stranded RNA-binding protein 2-like isoform X2 [Hibiscus syriacus]|uniref:double-stranded RNA-binding protein 2-like isoform X2 n=1 Tax=Hibiscus syriacus TaxID=106335 RepID=UPI0019223C93|nr:double-stranded RNA-binding protein 2-like isoform X2 [Hibiscus syriacus]